MNGAEFKVPQQLAVRIERYRQRCGERLGIPTINANCALLKLIERGLDELESAVGDESPPQKNTHSSTQASSTLPVSSAEIYAGLRRQPQGARPRLSPPRVKRELATSTTT